MIMRSDSEKLFDLEYRWEKMCNTYINKQV